LPNPWSRHEAAIHAHVGQRIKRARASAGLSHAELAGRLGTTAKRVAAFENGAVRLTARQIFEIAQSMEKSVSYFFADLEDGNGDGARPGDNAPAENAAAGGPQARLAETRALIAAFYRIPDRATRRDIIRLLRGIADDLR
jgi:transcriptional regulator with XRE-family HTH domain